MSAHKVVTVRRGEDAEGRPGYAAQCRDCDAVTGGGFASRSEARAAIAHEDDVSAAEVIEPVEPAPLPGASALPLRWSVPEPVEVAVDGRIETWFRHLSGSLTRVEDPVPAGWVEDHDVVTQLEHLGLVGLIGLVTFLRERAVAHGASSEQRVTQTYAQHGDGLIRRRGLIIAFPADVAERIVAAGTAMAVAAEQALA